VSNSVSGLEDSTDGDKNVFNSGEFRDNPLKGQVMAPQTKF